ncbi:MAG: hypothetical protein MJ206_03790 [Bacilli bacterium]|nr:hypothetical protein [Bacilli bacterium]
MATLSIIISVAVILCGALGFIPAFGMYLSIVGLILGAVAIVLGVAFYFIAKKANKKGKFPLIFSIVCEIFCIIPLIIQLLVFARAVK